MEDLILTHRVASYECGADRLMKPEWFMLHCQEIAERHAELNGLGYSWGLENHVIWVETVGDFEFFRRPAWKEEVTLRTNTGMASALQARRFVEMATPSGDVLARADLVWVLIDIDRRRPVPFRRVKLEWMSGCDPITTPMAAAPEGGEHFSSELASTPRDVDFNGHITNSAYLTWVLDAASSLQPGSSLRQAHIEFRKESHAGERMSISTRRAGMQTLHAVRCGEETRAELRLAWQ